ncbi:hypothetical protein PG5_05660 [Pseudomonas sp. G5(2012)]|nr:hypothetical protein PG5_05660 [Pseudomonas sp. G5(2012)]
MGLVAGALGILWAWGLPWVFREHARSYRKLVWAIFVVCKQEGPNVMPD